MSKISWKEVQETVAEFGVQLVLPDKACCIACGRYFTPDGHTMLNYSTRFSVFLFYCENCVETQH